MSDKFDQVWMTYDEAAEALGIKRSSVQRRAALRKWPKRKGNGKKIQVGIPPEAIPDTTPVLTHDITPDKSYVLEAENTGLKVEVKMLREKIDDRDKQLDDMRADRAKLMTIMEQLTQPKPSLWARISGSRK